MVWVGEIEDCVAQQDQKLFVFVHEHASEWAILGLDYDVLSRPLPELGLSRPKWLGVLTDDEGRVLTLLSLFFLFFTFTQCFYPQVRLILLGWTDFHFYNFRMFFRLGKSSLACDPESSGFITLHAWAVFQERSL